MFPSLLPRAASPLLTTASTSTASSQQPPAPPQAPLRLPPSKQPLATTLVAAAAAGLLLLSPAPDPSRADPEFKVYYGTAASAANYGGYGGNANKKDTAEYVYDVPEGWKERLVSKVEKGTNGTDSEFFNPRKRTEKEYLTFLSGIRALAPLNAVLNNLALSDVGLQDQIATADDVRSAERTDGAGQVYYEYEVAGAGAHSLISVTCARNKLYAHFVTAPNAEWGRDEAMLRRLHESFKTIQPGAPPPVTES
ncbi:Thylakoid lumenal 19 kDa protein, chloroplastic [Dichanthelium oligosanthes]|uniref:Thylakoid lumenal 19 kDa protein, chloroplastic n=1 Tax=Dichanthelium oligosanthes TaxID=888268 RepID=A0A1E5V5X3_9POAL|nr:Thylakoid lumenal 19 kDa protein, chloroplastic [Dichanthelium oligosanthes]